MRTRNADGLLNRLPTIITRAAIVVSLSLWLSATSNADQLGDVNLDGEALAAGCQAKGKIIGKTLLNEPAASALPLTCSQIIRRDKKFQHLE